jgi:peroxiredoxin Q/BCP
MTIMQKIGGLAPNFTTKDQDGKLVSLKDFTNQWLILYFYPKDNTPGCTTEAKEFTQHYNEFQQLGATVVGVSPDSEKTHYRFREKHGLTITLLSDPDHKIAEDYGIWQLKKFMGKEYMGIVRSTFLIDYQGKIVHIWSKVKAQGHAVIVLKELQSMAK